MKSHDEHAENCQSIQLHVHLKSIVNMNNKSEHPRSTQPSIPPAWLARVRAGRVHLCRVAGNTV